MRRASSSTIARSFRIQSTAKPKSNLPSTIVCQRFSICQDCAAPFEITEITAGTSRSACCAKWSASASPWTTPAMHNWLHILQSCPAPLSPMRATILPYAFSTGSTRAYGSSSPPHITLSCPFCAPACPPETGASMKCSPRARAASCSSRATAAEAVVWSTNTASGFMPWNAPSGPMVTSRTS